MIRLKRVYDTVAPEDGKRYLVERLWPRGAKKADLMMDAWLKDVAPSEALRRWFSHEPSRWAEFRRRYFAELDDQAEAWRPIHVASLAGTVTLLYSSHDRDHNNAAALRDYIHGKGGRIQAA